MRGGQEPVLLLNDDRGDKAGGFKIHLEARSAGTCL